jgi:hypothetical protein
MKKHRKTELYFFSCNRVRETAKAFWLEIEGLGLLWLPREHVYWIHDHRIYVTDWTYEHYFHHFQKPTHSYFSDPKQITLPISQLSKSSC